MFTVNASCFALMLLALMPVAVMAETPVYDGFQATYMYIGNSAHDVQHDDDYDELQGIANGDPAFNYPFWFFSRNNSSQFIPRSYIYKVGYQYHMNDPTYPLEGRRIELPSGSGYCWHIGDIDFHVYKGRAYIVAGYDNCDGEFPRIAIFKAFDIDSAYPPEQLLYPVSTMKYDPLDFPNLTSGNKPEAPWVAVRKDGRIYSGYGKRDYVSEIWEFTINWDEVDRNVPLVDYSIRTLLLKHEDGPDFSETNHQGGDFSTDEEFFYLTTGQSEGIKRIHAFAVDEIGVWYRVRESSNSLLPFLYETNSEEEPEGLSYFDMNAYDGTVYHPGMPRSELHVILLNNDLFSSDNIYLKHYTSRIYVDSSYTGAEETGQPDKPSKTVIGAAFIAWDSSIVTMQGGLYPENLTISKPWPILLDAQGGSAIIGQ